MERLGVGVVGLAGGLRRGHGAAPPPRRLTRVGLELYSVRDAMRRDPERTLTAIRAMGYTDVELLWTFGHFGRTPAQVRDALANAGLRASSAHISPAAVLVGWERSLETARLLGHEMLVVPSFTVDTSRTLDDWREWAERFNRAGEVARRAGVWLAFHNEPGHQRPIDGRVPFEVFAESTDPSVVRLQLDVGNMVMGGGDPHDFLARHGARCWSFHLKDVIADRTRDTELGMGTVDLRRILAAIPDVEQRSFFVEQEGSKDSMASAKADYDYLAGLEF
ncbi:MAG: sugar phosphate isomerase/epimerase family protein [Gemmatimonadota bacterium]